MQQVQALVLHHVHQFARQHQLVRLVFEERIITYAHLVVEHVRLTRSQPHGPIVGDEVDDVAFFRQGEAQFRGHNAGAAEGGIANDTDAHGC